MAVCKSVTIPGMTGHVRRNTQAFRIVGPDEIYGRKNYVSVHAPVVKACLGKCVGDEVIVTTPESKKLWEIDLITYQDD